MPRSTTSNKIAYIADKIDNGLLGSATKTPRNAAYIGFDNALSWSVPFNRVCYCSVCGLPFAVTDKQGADAVYTCAEDLLNLRGRRPVSETLNAISAETPAPAPVIGRRRGNGQTTIDTPAPATE